MAVTLTAATSACGGSAPRVATADRNLITAEEITQVESATAFEVIQRLRPRFLHRRGALSIRNPENVYPVVYVDGMRRGEVGELRQIAASTVATIEFISAADATTRWGTGHPAGVILIITRR
jgi:outer membrane cobalamin receptor